MILKYKINKYFNVIVFINLEKYGMDGNFEEWKVIRKYFGAYYCIWVCRYSYRR